MFEHTKAVLIDIDDTLLDFRACSSLALDYAIARTGYELPDNTFETFWTINNSLWEQVERGEITKPRLHEMRWNTIFHAMGFDEYDGPLFEEHFYGKLRDYAVLIPGADELLAYLSKKYNLYAASNSSHDQQKARLSKVGLDQYFTGIFVSESLGHQKPTKEFFDACFERMGGFFNRENTVLIGDSITADIRGGNRYGMETIWYNHNRKPNPTDPADYPTVKVDSLLEIKKYL